MAFVVLNRIVKEQIVPTNFNLCGLNFLPKNTQEPNVRQVITEAPYGTHRVRIEDGDTLTVLAAPDPAASSLT